MLNQSKVSTIARKCDDSRRRGEQLFTEFDTDDGVVRGHHGVSERYVALRRLVGQLETPHRHHVATHLPSNIPDDPRQRMVLGLPMLVPRRKVPQFSLSPSVVSFEWPCGIIM